MLATDDDAFPTAPDVAPLAHLGLREEAAVFGKASQNARACGGRVEPARVCPDAPAPSDTAQLTAI